MEGLWARAPRAGQRDSSLCTHVADPLIIIIGPYFLSPFYVTFSPSQPCCLRMRERRRLPDTPMYPGVGGAGDGLPALSR